MKKKVKENKISTQKNILPGVFFVALMASIIVFVIMLNIEKNELSSYEKGIVFIAEKDIPAGEIITSSNIEQYIMPVEIDKSIIAEDMVKELNHLTNKMTKLEIKKGSILTDNLFDSIDSRLAAMKDPVVVGCKSEDLYQVVSGILRAGDEISIYIVDEEEDTAVLGWENIYVLQALDSAGTGISAEDEVTAAQRLNIIMEQNDVDKFYSQLAKGSLRVVKEVN